jgi:phosphate transport system substrate-binding protein
MSEKKSTPAFLFPLLLTMALGGLWWLSVWQFSGGDRISRTPSPAASSPTPASSQSQNANGFADVQNVPSGMFNYGGSTTAGPLRVAIEPALQAARPEFRLRLVNPANEDPSSTSGIAMLMDGKLDFSLSSRSIKDKEYQQAQERGFSLTQIPVAIDGLAFVVHPDLNIPGLTLEQLKGIFLGKLTNWKEVGGPDLPINAVVRDPKVSGSTGFFIEEVLDEQPLGSSVYLATSTTDALRRTAQTPGSIYFSSAEKTVGQCSVKPIAIGRTPDKLVPSYEGELVTRCPEQRNRLNKAAFQSGDYPLTRNIFVIVKQNKGMEQQVGEAYANLVLSKAGQEIVAKAGFVPIR